MGTRSLPLFDGEEWIEFPSLALWFVLAYPEDELAAKWATVLLSLENREIAAGRQTHLSAVSKLALDDSAQHLIRRRMCGNVALQVANNIEYRSEPRIGFAVFAVSRWGDHEKTDSGRALPSDPSALRKYFRKYRNVAHLLAAYETLSDSDHLKLLTTDQGLLERLLIRAMKFEERFDLAEAFSGWDPWRIPPQFKRRFPPERYSLHLPPETEWLKEALGQYRPDEIR